MALAWEAVWSADTLCEPVSYTALFEWNAGLLNLDILVSHVFDKRKEPPITVIFLTTISKNAGMMNFEF